MTGLRLLLVSGLTFFLAGLWLQWRTLGGATAASEVRRVSLVAVIIGAAWAIFNLPFWRGAFAAISAITFFALMLPQEAAFFERHPHLVAALPFAAGFASTNLGRSLVGTVCTICVLLVLFIAVVNALASDPVLNMTARFMQPMVGHRGHLPTGCSTLALHRC